MLIWLYRIGQFEVHWISCWSDAQTSTCMDRYAAVFEQMTTFDFLFFWFGDFKSCYCTLRTNFTDIFSCIFRFNIMENKWSLSLFACRLKFDIIRCKFDIILVPSCRSCLVRRFTDNFNRTWWFNLNWFDLLWNFKDNFWRYRKTNLGPSYSNGKMIGLPADGYFC